MDQTIKAVKRNSNIELLRIVAMLMIISHHISVHSITFQLTDTDSIARMDNGLFNIPDFFPRLWLLDFGALWGPVANAIFIIISGMFMVRKSNNIDISKISKKLISQLLFSSVLLLLLSTLIYRLTKGVQGRYIGLIDVSFFNGTSWYVGYYFLVIIIGRFFLNSFLMKQDQKSMLSSCWLCWL